MSKPLEPGCLAYVKSTSTNILLHGRFVIALRPWAAGDIFHVDGERFAEPTEHDLWFIKPAREGDTLPILCSYQNDQVFRSEGPLAVERALHLQRIGGPGLVSDAEVLRERARDLAASPYGYRDVSGWLIGVEPVTYHNITIFSTRGGL